MNKVFFLFFFLSSFFLSAQDLIIMSTGEKIYCKITGEDSLRLHYSVFKNDIKKNQVVSKSNVKSFYYANGKHTAYSFTNPAPIDTSKQMKEILAQENDTEQYEKYPIPPSLPSPNVCFTLGFLEGGGSLIGADIEFHLGDNIGMQIGGGLLGFGAGLNIHFKPTLKSSFISLQYWHQGIGTLYTQSVIGPAFVFRANKLFTAQLGLGIPTDKGPAWPTGIVQPQVMLTYAIGLYICD